METFELKKEQLKLAKKIELKDNFDKIKSIAGIECTVVNNKLLACVVLCEFPSMKVVQKKTYFLSDPLPYKPGYQAYREMPAMVEAYNSLDEDADLILVMGIGINHPRKIGIASHLGLILNKPSIGVTQKLLFGKVEKGKIIYNNEIAGFEIKTKDHANPIYVSPGNYITLGSTLDITSKCIKALHKMPEPLHLAHKFVKKKAKDKRIKTI
jgi:deoxyribonuclease V